MWQALAAGMRMISLIDGTVIEEIEGIWGRAGEGSGCAALCEGGDRDAAGGAARGRARSGGSGGGDTCRVSLLPASAGDDGDC